MEFQKLIESRRSIRKYDGSKKVTKEQIETLISAATEAPSWKNSETARYYCVLSDEMTKRVREECLPGFNRERSENAALLVTTFVHTRAGLTKRVILIMKSAMAGVFTILVCTMRYFFSKRLSLA